MQLAMVGMSQSRRNLCSLLMTVVTLLTGVLPVVGTCAGQSFTASLARSCCCHEMTVKSSRACCTDSVEYDACYCSVNEELPAAPQERQNSDERLDVRISSCLVPYVPAIDGGQSTHRSSNAPHTSRSLSTLRHLAILCRWQT